MADGKVIIDTALDNSGPKRGISGLSGQLGGLKSAVKGIGAAVGAAFAVKAVAALSAAFEPAAEAAARLWEKLQLFAKPIGEGLQWLWENVLVPFGQWTISEFLPDYFDYLGSVLDVLTGILYAVSPLFLGLWEGFLKPVGEWAGGIIIDWMGFLSAQLEKIGAWISSHQGTFERLGEIIREITARVWEFLEPIANTVWETFKGILATIVEVALNVADAFMQFAAKAGEAWLAVTDFLDSIGVLDFIQAAIKTVMENIGNALKTAVKVIGSIIEGVIGVFSGLMDFIKAVFTGDWEGAWNAIVGIFSTVFGTVKDIAMLIWNTVCENSQSFCALFSGIWVKLWKGISDFFSGIWNGIKNVFSTVLNWIKTTWSGVSAWFKSAWESLWKGVGNFFIGVWNGIVGAFEAVVNWIIGGINWVLDKINVFLGGVSDLLSMVPGWDVNIRVSTIPEISFGRVPMLAQGAVIPPNREFMAMLGDQHSGRNLEAPEDLIRQIVREEGGGSTALLEAMREQNELLRALLDKPTTVEIDGNEIGRTADDWKSKRGLRVSGSVFANAY